MKSRLLCGAAALLSVIGVAGTASADSFVNGGFENGTASGWTSTGGYRGNITNANLDPGDLGGVANRSAVVGTAYVDPNVGAALGGAVYSGNHSFRVEDTINGGYGSVLTQTVNNYTDANIFFAWKAVLEGAHGTNDAATMIITLKDLTTNTTLITRQYNAASSGGGIDARFSLLNGNYYTPQWQIEQLAIGPGLSGHNFQLSVLAADCEPTGHFGYVYLDGFGAVTPPPVIPGGIPEPSTWAMMIMGFGLAGSALRRRRTSTALLAA
ncbi:PEPxxWA-CTERM sorting domain-containing protein [Phenylobacterium sp.]|uniref:PEPxxWA-CTERM sorting domain-containing protein n=1 Tax=Phenylobacterium sp. TaxID=1871053 RepID=UPI00286B32E9|nr:PEPxxWA-CTERM sorting domain-containing protein [Phenylobacterium sp.]